MLQTTCQHRVYTKHYQLIKHFNSYALSEVLYYHEWRDMVVICNMGPF